MILDTVTNFLDSLFSSIHDLQIDVVNYYLDHIAYQASSNDDYDQRKLEILKIAVLISEEIIGDRRVGIFRLNKPITYKERVIPVIELIESKNGQICASAFEHVEFVIQESFESLMQEHPQLAWDTSSASRNEFPHLKLKLSDATQIKFHHQDILEIVRLEKLKK